MKEREFMEIVIKECEKRSFMTYSFSKKGLESFRRWFYRFGKKAYNWSNWKCYREWNSFVEAFNVKLNED